MRLLVSPQPEITGDHRAPNRNDCICHIENTCVKRANTDKYEVANEAMPRNTVNQIAHPARINQSKANKEKPTKPTPQHEIRQQTKQANASTDGKYYET